MNDYGAFIERLKRGKLFLVASHYSPDGDAIGSTIALGRALEMMGKQAVLYNRDPLPGNLAFLPGSDRLVCKIPAGAAFDMSIMVDCAQRKRVSDEFASSGALGDVACIDHHKLQGVEADHVLLDDGAASTGEVVLRLVEAAGLPVGPELAKCIYTTLVVDTGFFRYSSTDARVLGLASRLVERGASPWEVAKNLEESYPESRIRLLARSLATLRVELAGRYATMDVTSRMLAETGAGIEYSDEFSTYPRSISGVEVAALFRELEPRCVKVSLRSKDRVDVAELARGMGGGGHARAAGVRIRASMDEAKRMMLEAVGKALNSVTGDS